MPHCEWWSHVSEHFGATFHSQRIWGEHSKKWSRGFWVGPVDAQLYNRAFWPHCLGLKHAYCWWLWSLLKHHQALPGPKALRRETKPEAAFLGAEASNCGLHFLCECKCHQKHRRCWVPKCILSSSPCQINLARNHSSRQGERWENRENELNVQTLRFDWRHKKVQWLWQRSLGPATLKI